jgi:hypothetical protein
MRELGVFKQLGIDEGSYFSDMEAGVAVCMAEAQSRVLALKGTQVEVAVMSGFGAGRVDMGNGVTINATIDGGAEDGCYRAVVVGATAVKQATDDVFEHAHGKNAVADYLLRSGYVVALCRVVETVEDAHRREDSAEYGEDLAPESDSETETEIEE